MCVSTSVVSGAIFCLFCTKVNDHHEDTGMDSISYLPDLHDHMNMILVVNNYSCFTLEYVISMWKGFKGLLDPYDQSNNQAAIKFLCTSVDPELDWLLHERMDVQDSFIIVWMHLVRLAMMSLVEKYDQLKERIKARLPSHYKGQDIIQLSQAFQEDARELTLACQYNHNLMLKMLQIFISAGADGLEAEDYHHPLCTKHGKLANELKTVVHMDYAQGTSYLNAMRLLYRDICTLAEDTYKNQKENGAWPLAKHAQDSCAVPDSFTNTLVQTSSGGGSSGFQGKCHKCGKHGHIAKKCPNKKLNKHLTPAPNHDKGPGGDNSKKWKYQAPGSGEAQTKDVDGIMFHWCGTCT